MKVFLIMISLLLTCASTAQVKMRDVFKALPDTIVPYLTENNRLDCIDFKEADMKAEVRNELDGRTELQQLTADYASLRLNEAVSIQMRLLPTTTSEVIICMVTTYGTENKESTIAFYTTKWELLDRSLFIGWPQDQIYTITMDSQEPVLTLTPTTFLEHPAIEGQQNTQILPINLKWNGREFK